MFKKTKPFSPTPEWPSSLPDRCDHCDNAYDIRFSLEFGPGRLARLVRLAAPLIIPILAIFLAYDGFGIFGNLLPSSHLGIALFITLPAITAYIGAGFSAKKARLFCHNCGKCNYLHPPETWGTPAPE